MAKKKTQVKKAGKNALVDKTVSAKQSVPARRNVMMGQKNGPFSVRNDKKYLVIGVPAIVVLILVLVGVILNYGVIRDFMVGMRYQPSAEMNEIRTELDLTDAGMRIFNASQPELMEKVSFNQKCREAENESAILGCYTEEKIYVYDVIDEELPGVRELTAAHELLHATYARMSDEEKMALVESLTRVFEENQELLGSEIEMYDIEQKQEELYVRAGTEIGDLSAELEKHYAKYFKERSKIVGFYEGYIAIFREIEKKLKDLIEQINSLKSEISTKTAEYEAGVESLNTKIREFNECAGTLNCFTSTVMFNNQRVGLISEQQRLKTVYDEISGLISRYNTLVSEYNENALHGQVLNMKINSSESVEEVED